MLLVRLMHRPLSEEAPAAVVFAPGLVAICCLACAGPIDGPPLESAARDDAGGFAATPPGPQGVGGSSVMQPDAGTPDAAEAEPILVASNQETPVSIAVDGASLYWTNATR